MSDIRDRGRATEKLADSADDLSESAGRHTESADRRTQLAADRTILAAERTYAAWVRTGLASLASGVGARSLLEGVVPAWLAVSTGSLLVLFAAFCFVCAVWREMRPGAPPPRSDTRRLPPLLLIGVNGILVLVTLAALLGILIVEPPE